MLHLNYVGTHLFEHILLPPEIAPFFFTFHSYFLNIFLWRARVRLPLPCLCRPFMILWGMSEFELESAAVASGRPSPLLFFISLIFSFVFSLCSVACFGPAWRTWSRWTRPGSSCRRLKKLSGTSTSRTWRRPSRPCLTSRVSAPPWPQVTTASVLHNVTQRAQDEQVGGRLQQGQNLYSGVRVYWRGVCGAGEQKALIPVKGFSYS